MKWSHWSEWCEARRDIWFDLLRIYLGLGLFIRGMIFFTANGEVALKDFLGAGGQQWVYSSILLHYVILAHLCGGFLLAFGLLTRLAAIVQIPVLIGAVVIHAPDGMFSLGQSLEFAAFVLVTLIIVAIAGPGRLSIDYYTFGRKTHEGDAIDGHRAPGHP